MNIMITCCLGDYTKSEIECLKNNPDNVPVRIIGVDASMSYQDDLERSGIDVFHLVPRIDEKLYISELIRICDLEEVHLLIPSHSGELELIRENLIDFLKIGTHVMLTGGMLHTANDKVLWSLYFKNLPIRIPEFHVVDSVKHLKEVLSSGKRYCIKLRNGCGSRGFFLISDDVYDESKGDLRKIPTSVLEEMIRKKEELFIQEYLVGDEYTVDLFFKSCKYICGAVKRCFAMKDGITTDCVIVDEPEIIDLCKQASEFLAIDGLIGFDLIVKDGLPYIIDINPRRTATISLVEKAGLPILWSAVMYSYGIDIDRKYESPVFGTRIFRKMEDHFVSPYNNA